MTATEKKFCYITKQEKESIGKCCCKFLVASALSVVSQISDICIWIESRVEHIQEMLNGLNTISKNSKYFVPTTTMKRLCTNK